MLKNITDIVGVSLTYPCVRGHSNQAWPDSSDSTWPSGWMLEGGMLKNITDIVGVSLILMNLIHRIIILPIYRFRPCGLY